MIIDEITLVFGLFSEEGPSRVMIDVGAHWGGSLIRFARAGWSVHAFEPDLDQRKVLVQNTVDLPQVRVDPRAVSNEGGRDVPFFKSPVSTGISGLLAFHPSHYPAGTVTTVTLADYLADANITDVDFLKIDCEGYDLFVLQGFPWDKIQPEAILCEFEDRKTVAAGYDFRTMADYLRDRDYRIIVSEWYPIVEYGRTHRWRRYALYPCELLDKNAWGNLIAVRSEENFKKLQYGANLSAAAEKSGGELIELISTAKYRRARANQKQTKFPVQPNTLTVRPRSAPTGDRCFLSNVSRLNIIG